jgi:putative nucleotidyltransferase with HDIG domain
MFAVPQTLQGAPGLRRAEREALAVLAEHTRRRARLDCVWLYAHPTESETDSDLQLVVRACAADPEPLADAAAMTAVAQAVRGDRRRFNRGGGQEAAGTRVATAANALSAVSAVGGPAEAASGPGVQQALAELAALALRLAATNPVEAAPPAPGVPAAAAEPGSGGGAAYGSALAAALTLLEQPPVLPESRVRLAAAVAQPHGALADVAQVVETDIGLALAVVGRANRTAGRPRSGIASVPQAVEALGVRAVAGLAARLPVASTASDRVGAALVRITPHAIATRNAADMVASRTGASGRDTLRLAALLHDVGKVALAAASATYLDRSLDPSATPGDRAARERRALGMDHAGLGGVALGRLGMPRRVIEIVERHHADDADGPAALLRLADMLAHEARGDAVDGSELAAAGDALGIAAADVRTLAYDLTRVGGPRGVGSEPSPLTPMQQKVLLGLRRGRTYKQIAVDLQVSESTVRSHLHKTYERLGVVDRAQAVLLAHDRGWI